jgi:hypothetical protein
MDRFSLFNDAESTAEFIWHKICVRMIGELERTGKEVVVACLKVLSCIFLERLMKIV